jgi:diguanylate cyclase (GGDEF)-like protein
MDSSKPTEMTEAGSPQEAAHELRFPLTSMRQAVSRLISGGTLTPEQRAQLAFMKADIDGLVRRVDEFLSPRTLAPISGTEREDGIPSGPTRDPGRFTVLVVDDDPAELEPVQEILAPYFNVIVTTNADEAASLVRDCKPDVVLSDLYMPHTGGLRLLEIVRGRDETSQIPLLVLSGSAQLEDKVRAFESGAFDYLTKPVMAGELVARVRNALVRSQAMRHERLLQETDDLTGLANRRALRSFLNGAIRETVATRKALTVAMVDQDGLKKINDRYGHAVGDEAIRAVSRALALCKRASDCAARYGGDEFVVVMPGTERDGALRFVERVAGELRRNPIQVGPDTHINVGASFGLSSYGEVAWEESGDQLLKRADAALYDVKSQRRAAESIELPSLSQPASADASSKTAA